MLSKFSPGTKLFISRVLRLFMSNFGCVEIILATGWGKNTELNLRGRRIWRSGGW